MSRLREIFERNIEGNQIHKWMHYFDIYERYFEKYVGKELNILEIGIFHGGSLQMWKEYFGHKVNIYAVDINAECKIFEDEQIKIFIGSQEDRAFLTGLKNKIPKMDIIIDDGGHTMTQQIISFEELYDHVKDDGIYLVEDTHTSYWGRFGGGLKRKSTFIEYSKKLVDQLNAFHYLKEVSKFTKTTFSMHFYDSIVVFEKKIMDRPTEKRIGKTKIEGSSFPYVDHRTLLGRLYEKHIKKIKY